METTTSTQTTAAVAIVSRDGYSIGFADRGVPGYSPTTYTYDTYDDAKAAAKLWNERAGLSVEQAATVVLSTMGRELPFTG